MTADNSSELFATYEVGLPVYTWSSTLLMVCNRKVRLLEGTIVRLVSDGVSDVDVITSLLGLDDRAIVIRTVQHLVERGALRFTSGLPLHVTEGIGKEMLAASLIKDERRLENVQIAYDPLRRTFCWAESKGSYVRANELRSTGGHPVRPPYPLSVDFLPQHFRDVQELVRSQPEKLRQHPLGKDVVRFELQEILPVSPALKFTQGKLEVSHHTNGEWTYRVLRQSSEDITSTDTLRAWEAGGDAVLPLIDMPSPPAKPAVKQFMAAIAPLVERETFITEEDQQRQQLREAIKMASRFLVIAPATGIALFSDHIAIWLDDALNNTSELKVLAGVEEGLTPKRRLAGPAGRQLAALRALQQKYPNRIEVLEMASVPGRTVVVDGTRIVLQTHDARPYNDRKFLQREVVVLPADATTQVGQTVVTTLKELFI